MLLKLAPNANDMAWQKDLELVCALSSSQETVASVGTSPTGGGMIRRPNEREAERTGGARIASDAPSRLVRLERTVCKLDKRRAARLGSQTSLPRLKPKVP